MRPLDRRQLSVLRVRAFVTATVLTVFAFVIDTGPLRETPIPFGLVGAAIAVLAFGSAWWAPARRYRSWAYAVGDEELHVQHGLLTRVRTVVPFGRVQHIDVAQGPIERRFGVGRLILHTAGTRSSAVALPGLAFEEAGHLRDLIRSHIRQDLA